MEREREREREVLEQSKSLSLLLGSLILTHLFLGKGEALGYVDVDIS